MKNNTNWFIVITEKYWGRPANVTPGHACGMSFEKLNAEYEAEKASKWVSGRKLIAYEILPDMNNWESKHNFEVALAKAQENL